MYLKSIALIIVLVVGILFGISNQQEASFYFLGYSTRVYPLYLILFASFFTGALVAFLYNIIAKKEMTTREKLLRNRLLDLEERYNNRLHKISAEEKTQDSDGEELDSSTKTPPELAQEE